MTLSSQNLKFEIIHFQLVIETTENFQVIDITQKLQDQLLNFRASAGQVLVAVQHTTTALTINENETRLPLMKPWAFRTKS